MTKKRIILFATAVVILALLILSISHHFRQMNLTQRNTGVIIQEDVGENFDGKYHDVNFVDKELFFKSVSDYPKHDMALKQIIRGGIVPHHLLPSFIIAEFFSRLSEQQVDTVILIGPNHYERGDSNVLASRFRWNTPLGSIEPDLDIIGKLDGRKLANAGEEAVSADHSMTAILPFIKYYLPQAKVAPFILKRELSEKSVNDLAAELDDYMRKHKAVIVASVDFSHYLTNSEAKKKNIESLDAIEKRDYSLISSFNNDHMDSPPSIEMLLKSMDGINADNMEVLNDTNSGELTGDDFAQVTSYLSLFFAN